VTPAQGVGEATARRQVATACRVLELAGQGDHVWGHVSVRDRDGRGVWVKAAGLGFDEVTEDDVILVAWTGDVLVGGGARHIEFPIHTELTRARPDVGAVVHAHPLHAVAFAATGRPLRPLSHEGAQFVPPALPRFDLTGQLVDSADLGQALAAALGEATAILMPRHGITTVGASVDDAVGAALHLDRACQVELLAGATATGSSDAEAEAKRTRAPSRFRLAYGYMARKVTIPASASNVSSSTLDRNKS
jgi:L-fuculose-phosphate aldolase